MVTESAQMASCSMYMAQYCQRTLFEGRNKRPVTLPNEKSELRPAARMAAVTFLRVGNELACIDKRWFEVSQAAGRLKRAHSPAPALTGRSH